MIKKNFLVFLIGAFALALVSWGYVGHQTVARIAENHLSPQAKVAVKSLLGSEAITDVASWADEVRNDPAYKNTAPWHFLNLPLGLDYAAFEKAVKGQRQENVYSAILAQEKVLKNESSTREQKVISLKFLVHFIGDAHQPMHISRAEDKGGNTIQLQYDNKGTNLHSLWDSRLIDQEGLSYRELAGKVDQATPQIVKQAENTDPMAWVWESYQISSKLYPEIEKNNKLGEDYYKAHIEIVNERLELAGLRLAAVLNALFKNAVIPAASTASASTIAKEETVPAVGIDAKDAAGYTGKLVKLTSKAYSHSDKGSFVLVNLGAEFPNALLTLVLRGPAKTLAENIDGKMVTVTGKVIDYKGRPEIEVRDTAGISLK
ncbi:S1/P1 nuclease [Mucilaginibacter arboris]|uniref:S1/P1 Nuclease n=1 Tax=Mucilaginibacter arboris TaxID=2682090 RepID=A0A7K1T0D3_9SPHI|nr:S1/P1 nuclease [Mucilaginibacter arboris]MVN22977.1 hypothetical protein [Mucilaginibacter arboris]